MDCLQPLSLASSWYHVSAGWHLLPNAWSVRRSRCEASRGERKGGYTLILLYLHVSTIKYVSGLTPSSVFCGAITATLLAYDTSQKVEEVHFRLAIPSVGNTFDGLFIRLKTCVFGQFLVHAETGWSSAARTRALCWVFSWVHHPSLCWESHVWGRGLRWQEPRCSLQRLHWAHAGKPEVRACAHFWNTYMYVHVAYVHTATQKYTKVHKSIPLWL